MTRPKRRPIRVAGEPVEALLPGLLAVRDSMVIHDDGMASMYTTLPAEQAAPLTRAMFRVEAELLQRDARVWDELARTRTSENRRADALLLLAQRVARAVQRSLDGHP
ncbi:MAG TPA: hypothetical protein VF165_21555, partial [Nocardioidaceae bacterium]